MEHTAMVWIRMRVPAVLLAAGAVLLAGCTLEPPVPSGTVPEPAETARVRSEATSESVDAAPGSGSETEPAVRDGTMASLTFAVQESTFLSQIEQAVNELGAPDEHFYVEFETEDGDTWQGERFGYTDRDVVFLQRAASDGLSAMRLELPAGADRESMVALLQDAQAGPAAAGDAPNVDVQFVRARLTDSEDGGVWAFDVTVEHPDTGWEDYTDGWHVETSDGRILGTRILLHPHVRTNSLSRAAWAMYVAPEGTTEIRIRPHDLVSGYGAATKAIPLGDAATGEGYEVVR